MVLGRKGETHRWEVASKYRLLNAGGGSRYWKPLRTLKSGDRVFAHVSGRGYVGIGLVTETMLPARQVTVKINGQLQPLLDQPELDSKVWEKAGSEDPEETEMCVHVKWIVQRPLDQAFWEKGLFANQTIVCELSHERTIKTVESALGLKSSIVALRE